MLLVPVDRAQPGADGSLCAAEIHRRGDPNSPGVSGGLERVFGRTALGNATGGTPAVETARTNTLSWFLGCPEDQDILD